MNENDGPLIARLIYEEVFKDPMALPKDDLVCTGSCNSKAPAEWCSLKPVGYIHSCENISIVPCLSISKCEWQKSRLIDSVTMYNDNKWRVQALVM